MAREKQWVGSLRTRFESDLCSFDGGEWRVCVDDGKKLAYAYEILAYSKDGAHDSHRIAKYETDLLIYDSRSDGGWVPRIVVECKIGITTHDALTYSTKASTHKHIHPYLRYGILISCEASLPGRLIQHGAYFDFMAVWTAQEPTQGEWNSLVDVLAEEVRTSRTLHAMLSDSRSKGRKKYKLLHRPLRLSD